MEVGNLSKIRSVGSGALERRIHIGIGYRIYFGKGRKQLTILLGGGTKERQQKDIEDARVLCQAHMRCKQQEV